MGRLRADEGLGRWASVVGVPGVEEMMQVRKSTLMRGFRMVYRLNKHNVPSTNLVLD